MVKKLLVAVVILVGAGCSQNAPSAPTPVVTPLPVPVAVASATLIDVGVPGVQETRSDGFALRGVVQNVGAACGVRIGGQAQFTLSGTEVARLRWTIDPARVLRPLETATYDVCCLPLATSGKDLRYFSLLQADTIPCP